MFMSSFFSRKGIKVFEETFQDFSMQLQRALHNPSRRIRVLSREIIGHFLIKIQMYILFNHKYSSCTSSAMHVHHSVTCDVGGSTNPVFTKWMFKQSQTPFSKIQPCQIGPDRLVTNSPTYSATVLAATRVWFLPLGPFPISPPPLSPPSAFLHALYCPIQ